MYVWLVSWLVGWLIDWLNEWKIGLIDECIYVGMYGRIDTYMDGVWMARWMDG